MSGAPLGNKNAEKGRVWGDALRRAIAQDDGRRLRASIEQLLDSASLGEPWAIRELADRLDGKARQASAIEPSETNQVTEIKIVFVSPDGSESADTNS